MYNFKAVYFKFYKLVLIGISIVSTVLITDAQSSDQNFPTPVTSNQLSGLIKARDIGDSRLTTYFFTFESGQGDIFVNVLTKNLNGDIDIFSVEGVRPLTKIVVYADNSENETGRVIYLRKSEKILMRIQGRSPNDDAAEFQIKFAGSFIASSEVESDSSPKMSEVKKEKDSGVIVNSVGTIIGIKPKPTPAATETVAEKVEPSKTVSVEEKMEEEREQNEPEKFEKPEVTVTENKTSSEKTETTEIVSETDKNKSKETKTLEITNEPTEKKLKVKKERVSKTKEKPKKVIEPNPLENIHLVILLKDGGRLERPMSDVVKFGVEKGMLTIINKDGSISRYSILDVAKVTIE
ncbi:MAG: hypothetical protein ABIP06_04160 [Pyrinomonadaceae bacterium]